MGLSLEKIRENRAKAKEEASRRNANFFNFQSGRNFIRILPPWEGADDFSRPMGKHWNLGPEGNIAVFCPRECAGLPCPICEELDKIWKTKPDEETKAWLRQVGASRRYYVNLLDLNDLEKGVQIGELPKTVIEEIWNIMVDEDTGIGDVTNWKEGFDLIIEKTGKALNTRYSVRAKRAPSAISRAEYEEKLVNLDNFVKTESYSDLKLIWEGKTPTALPAPPEDETPHPAESPDEYIEGEIVSDAEGPVNLKCFGSFNEDVPACLDCPEQDECEAKMLKERAAATEAIEKAPSATPKAPKAAEAPATPKATASADDTEALMAEMEKAITG